MKWQTGEPKKSGYYLAAWYGGITLGGGKHLVVSELWFNPDATPRWWHSRVYLRQSSYKVSNVAEGEVVAWMPMPVPPRIKELSDGSRREA